MGLLALAVALTTVAATPAPADRASARQLFEAGGLAYDRGRYADASQAFEAAYKALPAPEIAFSLAQAHRRQYFVDRDGARALRAVELYRSYLAQVPEGGRREDAVEQLQRLEPVVSRLEGLSEHAFGSRVDADATQFMIYSDIAGAEASVDGATFVSLPAIVNASEGGHKIVTQANGYATREEDRRALAGRLVPVEIELEALPAKLQLRANRRARVYVDGREAGRTPLRAPITVPAGEHVIAVRAAGRVPAQRRLSFERAQKRRIDVTLPATAQRQAAWALLGCSAGLLVAGGGTMGAAFVHQRRAQRTDALRGERNIDAARAEALAESLRHRDNLRGATVGLWSVGVAAGVVGLVLLVSDRGVR